MPGWKRMCWLSVLGLACLALAIAARAEQGDKDSDSFVYGYQQQKRVEPLEQLKARAQAGDAKAQYQLGLRYLTGDDAPQHYGRAADWLRRSADQGNVDAQFRLGRLREEGRGGERDLIKAHKWYNLAASGGSSEAALARDRLTYRMRPADVQKAQDMAEHWKPVKETGGGAAAPAKP